MGGSSMGIENSSKVYVLSHTHKFSKQSECFYGHKSEKLIGIFYSKEKALNTLERYKDLEGFKNHTNGFQIQEYVIDDTNRDKLNELLENKKAGKYSEVK